MPANVDRILERHEDMKTARVNWDSHYDEVADLVRPEISFNSERTPGEKRRFQIYDDTAVNAHAELAANLDATLTNSQIRWLELVPADPTVDLEDDETQRWLYAATSIMLRHFENSESGFATAIHEVFLDLGSWGTAAMTVKEKPTGPRFSARPLSECFIDGDDDGDIDAVHRCYREKDRDIEEDSGALPPKLAAMARKEPKKRFRVLHAIYRRYDNDPTKVDAGNKPWASCYLCEDTKELLREGGFDYLPVLTPRWEIAAGELYGRSPAMRALPAIKAINAMAKMSLEATELTIRPPLMVPANGIEGNISTRPGSLIYMKSGTREFPQPLNHGARPDFAANEIERRGKAIREAFYVDRLRLPEQDRMTATEIVARQRQGLLVFSPILGRMYAELLNPIIQITYSALTKAGRIPAPPASLAGKALAVVYMSPLASSRGSAQLDAVMQTINAILPLGQIDPSAFDAIDFDRTVRLVARASSLDPTALKKVKEVKAMRDQRQQAMQMQAGAEIAATGAKAMKDITGATNARA